MMPTSGLVLFIVSLSAVASACASPSAPAPVTGDAGSAKASAEAPGEAARGALSEGEAGHHDAPPATGEGGTTPGRAGALPVETLPSKGQPVGVVELARHRPAGLDEPAKRANIKPGPYACRVGAMYKMRDCTVERDADGRTWLTVHEDNLIAMKGLLWDDGAGLVFEGWLTEERPFGCYACDRRCEVAPNTCVCQEMTPEAHADCVRQPMKVRFRRVGGGYEGKLTYATYLDQYAGEGSARHVVGFERSTQQFSVRLAPRGKP